MSSPVNAKLVEAFVQQFQWIKIFFTSPTAYNSFDKKAAGLFLAMHVTFAIAVLGHGVTIIFSWMILFMLQAVALGLSLLQLVKVEEYAQNMTDAQGLERIVNPVVVASFSMRVFLILECLISRSWLLLFVSLLEIGYDVVANKNFFMVDATTVWKEVKALRLDSRIRVGYQFVVCLLSIFNFIWSLVHYD